MPNAVVVHSINVSNGGVPKLPLDDGPSRAVCLYSLELIEALRAEGHPITPGSIGENLTVSGLDWKPMTPGVRLEIGPLLLELTDYAAPCRTVRIGERAAIVE